jgi:hypothetical protein
MSGRATGHSEATMTDEHGIPSIRVLREGRLRHPSVFAKQDVNNYMASCVNVGAVSPKPYEDTSQAVQKGHQQGRSKRRGESYFVPYVEPLSVTRTPLVAFFNRLLTKKG